MMCLTKRNVVISMNSMREIRQFSGLMMGGLSLVLFAACSSVPNKAPVVERPEILKTEVSKSVPAVIKPSTPPPLDLRTNYVVKKGDTLYRIALDHGQSYSDIVAWNNLKNPNDIKIDQVLRIASPDASATANVVTEVKNPNSPAPLVNKTSPKGGKQVYSDAVLQELQKPDQVSVGVAVVPPVKVETIAAKPSERIQVPPVPQTVVETEDVDWIWPTDGKVAGGFDDSKNKGLDINGKLGQDILAAGAGKVMYEGSGIRGYGNLVIIKHTNNLLSAYAHNRVNLVKEGQSITKGQKIAEMGNSDSDVVKLHFEIRQQGKPVDPSKFLPAR